MSRGVRSESCFSGGIAADLTPPRSSEVQPRRDHPRHDLERSNVPASFSRPYAGSAAEEESQKLSLWLSGTAQAASHAAICLAFST